MKSRTSHCKEKIRVRGSSSRKLVTEIQRQHVELTMIVRALEHDKSIHPRFWQLVSLRKLIGEIDAQIANTHPATGRKYHGYN